MCPQTKRIFTQRWNFGWNVRKYFGLKKKDFSGSKRVIEIFDFFHNFVREQMARDNIFRLRDASGTWVSDLESLRSLAHQHFMQSFSQPPSKSKDDIKQALQHLHVLQLSVESVQRLQRAITIDEVEQALFQMRSDSTSGLDGFHAHFHKRYWSLMREYIFQLVKEFYETGRLSPIINHTCVVLIKKYDSRRSLNDFRPISLCNVLYKNVSKSISNRLKGHLEEIITPFQNAFVPGRQISDNILIFAECCIKFRTFEEIKLGDPLSPYLFVITANILFCRVLHEENQGKWKAIKVAQNSLPVTHLIYADNTVLFGHAKEEDILILTVDKILQFYGTLSVCQKIGRYLGAYLDEGQNRSALYQEVIHKVDQKLQAWKAQCLSQAGRLTLINSVLVSLLTHPLSHKALPLKYFHLIDMKLANFFWGSPKLHLKKWDSICVSNVCGGLGIKRIAEYNTALLGKQAWCLISTSPNSLLSQVLHLPHSYHLQRYSSMSCVWEGIISHSDIIVNHLKCKIVKLWWPRQFPLPLTNMTIVNLTFHTKAKWNPKLLNHIFYEQARDRPIRMPFPILGERDGIIWNLNDSREYTVGTAYNYLMKSCEVQSDVKVKDPWLFIWKLHVYPRVQLFSWKLVHYALPLRGALKAHHHQRINEGCAFCGEIPEDLVHLFFQCPFAQCVWFGSQLSLRIMADGSKDDVNGHLLPLLLLVKQKQHDEPSNKSGNSELIAIFLYVIWQSRKGFTFKTSQITPMKALTRIRYYYNQVSSIGDT
ncbi:uncharacterized protein LOC129305332 [Prosopis cineraria]|uniref:uncharacterized protein LOC129305332 n=1 Tax=Prosopis cineraria TaxID=364024 RepID=UPI0024108202|nr:uncharacterized protein LOC129305332 [Prosopis cineraria]